MVGKKSYFRYNNRIYAFGALERLFLKLIPLFSYPNKRRRINRNIQLVFAKQKPVEYFILPKVL